MSTSTSTSHPMAPTKSVRPASRKLFPEGISTFILLLLLVGVSSLSVERGDWERILIPVTLLGVCATIFGALLAKLNVLDSIAHFCSMILAIGGSFFLVLSNSPELAPGLRDRARPLIDLIGNWYLGRGDVDGRETYLVSMLMGVIVWLVGYLAAWTLFRRGWLLVSLMLPGFLVLVNLLYAPHPEKRFVAAYLLIAIPLAARYHLYLRERAWARFHVASPATGATRFLLIGTVIGILITTAGWLAPTSLSQSAFQPLTKEVTSQADGLQSTIADVFDQAGQRNGGGSGGSYSAFGESFSVGGAPNLTDQPEMLVQANQAPYLAAQRYDDYSGRGWSTDVDTTFDGQGDNGQSYSPSMTFRSGQEVILSPDVRGSRVDSGAQITALTDRNNVLLTVDTYLSADVGTSVQMSWSQLNETAFPLAGDSVSSLPPDLRQVSSMLIGMQLIGGDSESGPLPVTPDDVKTLQDEREQLKERFLEVHWTASSDGVVDMLYVTGQLPVYDDVETVRSKASLQQGETYAVAGLASRASADELMGAGVDYPEWVENRYLSLPTTVTPRTMNLAASLGPANISPYERAVEIEAYLRENITYDDTVSAPPASADIVDYVLFERERGYCEYYASAMAVMLRTVGVPARVVTGYYPGDYDADQGGFVYRQNNAHAWVEAYFPGYGWVSFEPTASRPLLDQGVGDPTQPSDSAEGTVPAVTATPEDMPPVATPPADTAIGADLSPGVTQVDGGGVPRSMLIGGGLAVAIVAVLGGLWFTWRWRLRGLDPSSALYVRMVQLARLAGIRTSQAATPHEFADSFARSIPAAREHADRIVHAYELDQYGPNGASQGLLASASEAWSSLRAHALRIVLRRKR